MVTKGLLARYVADVPTAKLVTSEAAKHALGTDVDGYVMPMFNSQTAIAYNAEMVSALNRKMVATVPRIVVVTSAKLFWVGGSGSFELPDVQPQQRH